MASYEDQDVDNWSDGCPSPQRLDLHQEVESWLDQWPDEGWYYNPYQDTDNWSHGWFKSSWGKPRRSDKVKKQTRISAFFKASKSNLTSSNGSNLLDLPAAIRRIVYEHLHLSNRRHEEVYLNPHKTPEEGHLGRTPSRTSSPAYTLLLTCRTLYKEVIHTIYSRNHFVISHNSPLGLTPLLKLHPLAISSLTSLTILLHDTCNACKTDGRYRQFDHDGASCRVLGLCEPSLSFDKTRLSSASEIELLPTWRRLCQRLSDHVQASRLRLCLICDTSDVSNAKSIVYPLNHMPKLTACSIRLSKFEDPDIRRLATETALSLVDGPSVEKPPPFLPLEIQTKILEYSDLVAPKKLTWMSFAGWAQYLCQEDGFKADYDWNVMDNQNPCELCLRIHEHWDYLEQDRCGSFSQCRCWRFPKSLFLLSTYLNREATRIFYSSNHFIINGPQSTDVDHLRKDCPLFLDPLRSNALPLVKSLQIGVPFIYTTPLDFGCENTLLWTNILETVQQYANLSKLTLTLDMSRACSRKERFQTATYRSTFQNNEAASLMEQQMVSTMTGLGGLKDFFVYGTLPWEFDLDLEKRGRRERKLERLVMGKSYDSVSRGKLPSGERPRGFGINFPWD